MPQDQLSSFFTAVVFKSGINRYNRKDGGKEMNRVMDTDELKKRWNEMDEEARIRMICMLYQRSADAGRMIDAELLGSAYPRRLFERARKQLHRCFFPEDEIRGFSLNYAKEIVTAFQEQCDDPGLIAELKLCFAQYAVQLDHQAGEFYERYYAVTARMYEEAASAAAQDRTLFQRLRPQLEQVMNDSQTMGWGLGEFIQEAYRSMLKQIEER